MSFKPIPLQIAGLGRYLPPRVVKNAEVERLCSLTEGWIESKTGVRERRWATGETNSSMGSQAARQALNDARMEPRDVDLIINASGSQEQAIPDGGALLQRELGLGGTGIAALSIHATCLSFVAALDFSASLLASGRYRTILIVSSEIGSVGLNFSEPESASLIGDAAAAVVVRRPRDLERGMVLAAHFETYGEGADLTCIRGGGSRRHPNRAETRSEDNLFHMDGPQVYRLARPRLGDFMEKLRPGLSKGLGTISRVIPHQPSLLAIRSLRKYGIPDERVVVNLDRLGNCIAASVPLALYDAVSEGKLRRGEEALLIGTGAGISFGGLILVY